MDVLSIEAMVQLETKVFASGEATAEMLMEAAGREMASRIAHYFPEARDFLVLVGKGNNGGDGLVIARHLASDTRNIEVILTVEAGDLGELARKQLARLQATVGSVEVIPWNEDLKFPGSDGVVIDALLGVQAKGALRGNLPEIVRRVNAERRALFFRTVAVDLPSGLAAFVEGEPRNPDDVIIADLTLAVGFVKDLLCREALAGWVGRLEVIPWSREGFQSRPRQALFGSELAGLLPRRSALSHKNDFGRVVLVAGGPGFSGAAGLCSQAAQAMGAGLLSVVTHPDATAIVAAQAPHEAMVSGWSSASMEVLEKASAIAIGPGLGTGSGTLHMLEAVLAVGCPVLIDADALTVLAENLDLLEKAKGDVLLTPHPGEMSRLIGRKFKPDEREEVARDLTDRHKVTLVLKGTRTLITARGQPFYYNTTGNPGLSTGGSGDTLSGLLAALLGQKLNLIDAARFGVWIHGHAADLSLGERGCEEGMTPTQLSAHLGAALVSLRRMAMVVDGLLENARRG